MPFSRAVNRYLMKQNTMQFGNTETEKGPGRERCHEHGKNKVININKNFKLTIQFFKDIFWHDSCQSQN